MLKHLINRLRHHHNWMPMAAATRQGQLARCVWCGVESHI